MGKHEVQAIYHLPNTQGFDSTQELIRKIVEPSDEDREWWGGFKGKQYLLDELKSRYEGINPKDYQPLNESQFEEVKSSVKKTTDKVVDTLPPPKFDVTIHLYPWFEPEGEMTFGGVNGKTFFWERISYLFGYQKIYTPVIKRNIGSRVQSCGTQSTH